jgi:hypothetical protein
VDSQRVNFRFTNAVKPELAELRHWPAVCLTIGHMLNRIARLFTIKTRLEAFLVTYAIAVGAVERGMHYMQTYPGNGGVLLALACLGVPFIAGAKLVDSVKPAEVVPAGPKPPARRHAILKSISRNRPRARPSVRDSASPSSHHTD